jgi:hypothetical protein
MSHVEGTVENGSVSGNHRRRVIVISALPRGRAVCRPI